jgi:hypothetical protein
VHPYFSSFQQSKAAVKYEAVRIPNIIAFFVGLSTKVPKEKNFFVILPILLQTWRKKRKIKSRKNIVSFPAS